MIQSVTASRMTLDASPVPGAAETSDGRFALSFAAIGASAAVPVERQVASVDGNALPGRAADRATGPTVTMSLDPSIGAGPDAMPTGEPVEDVASGRAALASAPGAATATAIGAQAGNEPPVQTREIPASSTAIEPCPTGTLAAALPKWPRSSVGDGPARPDDPERKAKRDVDEQGGAVPVGPFASVPPVIAPPPVDADDEASVGGDDPGYGLRTVSGDGRVRHPDGPVPGDAVPSGEGAAFASAHNDADGTVAIATPSPERTGAAAMPIATGTALAPTGPSGATGTGAAIAPTGPAKATGTDTAIAPVASMAGYARPNVGPVVARPAVRAVALPTLPADPIPPAQRQHDRNGPETPVPAPQLDREVGGAAQAQSAPRAGSAGRVFAAALHQASRADARDAAPSNMAVSAVASAATLPPPQVVGANAPQTSLDMGHHAWPAAMIAHIERLRDAADAADTSIRVVPDALGTIDIAVRRDGDTVHVHLSAEQAATRTMLADAQPRLVELADQRGLKLGQTSIDAGGQGQGRPQPQPQQPSRPPARPPSASTAAATDAAADDTDMRLA